MTPNIYEQILLCGFATTGVTSAAQQAIAVYGFSGSLRVAFHMLVQFAYTTRRFLFEAATRELSFTRATR